MSLVLETLWSDETLDARSLGVWLGALLLRLDLTTNDELANLQYGVTGQQNSTPKISGSTRRSKNARRWVGEEE